jgi:hypothetical protein
MIAWAAAIGLFCAAAPTSGGGGSITGIVVNATDYQAPLPGVTVILRIDDQGPLIPVAEVKTDLSGRFRFDNLSALDGATYLPGANYKSVHYPGVRVRTLGQQPVPDQTIRVYEPIADPSPLLAGRHEIFVRAEAGVLAVTETIIVLNRTLRSYVGQATPDAEIVTTLRLSIPPEFEKVTFEKEFFGRQFHLKAGRLETQVPWTPGQRELKFTYRLPFQGRHWLFRRPLDLPCEHVRISVARDQIGEVVCNLPKASELNSDTIVFEASTKLLPAGHVVEVELRELPIPWNAFGRWGALATLLALVTGTTCLMRRRVHSSSASARRTSVVETIPSSSC